MTTWKLVVGFTLLLAIVAAGLWWRSGDPEPPAGREPVDATASTAPDPAASVASANNATADRDDTRVVVALGGDDQGPPATIRGRCVDQGGQPLAGCTLQLFGSSGDSERVEAWRRDHGELPANLRSEPMLTSDDGKFRCEFAPPPPFQFFLHATADGCAPMSVRWSALAPGSTTDIGDIAMSLGVRVSGRVVDTLGALQAKTDVILQSNERPEVKDGQTDSRRAEQTRTDAAGRFAIREPMLPGRYQITTRPLQVAEPTHVELTADVPQHELTIVVAPLADVPTITGRVVDETGAPVESARIEDRLPSHGRTSYARTGRDGRFELRAEQGHDPKQAALVVSAESCECDPQPRRVSWGSEDIEFRITRGGTLTVRVTDPAERPIERYSVRMMPRGRSWSSADGEIRANGSYENGTATVPGLTRGDWRVMIEFASDSGFEPLLADFTAATRDVRLDLRAEPGASRSVRVEFVDGTPAVGSQVQLCDLFGGGFTMMRWVMPREQWIMNAGQYILELCTQTTDGDGAVLLRGPGSHPLGLRVTGPGHLDAFVTDLQLGIAAPFVAQVRRGARLVGRVTSPEALAELRRHAGVGIGEPFPDDRLRPRLNLASENLGTFFPGSQRQVVPERLPLLLADDGTFDAGGIPPGNWNVHINADPAEGGGRLRRKVAEVTLVDEQTTRLDLDLTLILPGMLEATVTLNGLPYADSTVTLQNAEEWINLTTNAEGRFTERLRPGNYDVTLQKRQANNATAMLRCAARVTVVRDETVRQTFAVTVGVLQLRVRDHLGQPVAGITVKVFPGGEFLPPTNSEGRVTLDVVAQNATLCVPPTLSAAELQRLRAEANAAGRVDPYEGLWLELGKVVVQPGQTAEVEMTLPKDWQR